MALYFIALLYFIADSFGHSENLLIVKMYERILRILGHFTLYPSYCHVNESAQ